MGRRMRAVVALVVLGAVLGPSGVARAQEEGVALTITQVTAAPIAGSEMVIHVSGTTVDSSQVLIYADPGGTDCAVSGSGEAARANVKTVDIGFPGLGTIDYDTTFKPSQAADFRICAYLYFIHDNTTTRAPRASSSIVVPVIVKPGSDKDGDGKPDLTDECPTIKAEPESGCPVFVAPTVTIAKQKLGKGVFKVSVTANQPCTLIGTGTVGGVKLQTANGSGDARKKTLTMRLTKANVAKVKKLMKRKKSVSATVTVAATIGEEEDAVTFKVTRTFTVTR